MPVSGADLTEVDSFESAHSLWLVFSYGDAGLLCAGKSQPVVHSRVCRGLHIGVGLWISSGRVALWIGRRCLGPRGRASLAGCATALMADSYD